MDPIYLLPPLLISQAYYLRWYYPVLSVLVLPPLLNWLYYSRMDRKRIQATKSKLKTLRVSNGYTLAYRFTEGSDSLRYSPVCIPNGLAATIAHTGKMHLELQNLGFPVLSYERYGVGFSETNNNRIPTVEDCMKDMKEIMEHVLPPNTKWILLGPSMGSVVAQCFITTYPEKVIGFMNMDGFPAPFSAKRANFMSSAKIYRVFSLLAWLGFLRPGMYFAKKHFVNFATPLFSIDVITALMNQPSFWKNTSFEFSLMMDLADEATKQWGPLDVLSMTDQQRLLLWRACPSNNGDFQNGAWVPLERSKAENGSDWDPPQETAVIQNFILEHLEESPLGKELSRMPVRVMSARDYNYFGGDSFYDKDMKMYAACEHNVQMMLGHGRRYTFPKIGHNSLFQNTDAICQCMLEIQQTIEEMNKN